MTITSEKRTVFYPVQLESWLKKVEIAEYLIDTPFTNKKDCVAFCKRKKIRSYTKERQQEVKVMFDDDLEWDWETIDLEIINL